MHETPIIRCPRLIEIGLLEPKQSCQASPHKHEDITEIIFVEQGKVQVMIENCYKTVQAGSLVVYHPAQLHFEFFLKTKEKTKIYYLKIRYFQIKGLDSDHLLPENTKQIYDTGDMCKLICSCFQVILEESRKQMSGFEQVIYKRLEIIMLQIYSLSSDTSSIFTRKEESREKIALSARNYLDECYKQEDIRLEKLAEKMGVSKYYIAHCFTACYGIAPMQYLKQKRIEEAKRLLFMSGSSISEIADYVGYENVSVFIRIFRMQTGISPGQYRKVSRISGEQAGVYYSDFGLRHYAVMMQDFLLEANDSILTGKHMHNNPELLFIYKGIGEVFLPNRKYLLKEGDLVMINPETEHYERFEKIRSLDGTYKIYSCEIQATLKEDQMIRAQMGIRDHIPVISTGEMAERFADLFTQIHECKMYSGPCADQIYADLSDEMLLLIQRMRNFPDSSNGNIYQYEELSQILNYIDAHFCEEINTSTIAAALNMSRHTLMRIFRSGLNMSPSQYLRRKRLQKARELILETDKSFQAVSEAAGFLSYAQFYKAFHSHYGFSPREYREKRAGNCQGFR